MPLPVCVCEHFHEVAVHIPVTYMYCDAAAGTCLEGEAVVEGGQLQLVGAVVPQLNVCGWSRTTHKAKHKILE